jgi:hypothetical protein
MPRSFLPNLGVDESRRRPSHQGPTSQDERAVFASPFDGESLEKSYVSHDESAQPRRQEGHVAKKAMTFAITGEDSVHSSPSSILGIALAKRAVLGMSAGSCSLYMRISCRSTRPHHWQCPLTDQLSTSIVKYRGNPKSGSINGVTLSTAKVSWFRTPRCFAPTSMTDDE